MLAVEPISEDADIQRTVSLLGGDRILRRRVRTRLEAHDLLQEGLTGHTLRHVVDTVASLGASRDGALEKALGISLRTYQRRQDDPDGRLSTEQSGRAWKFAEILGRVTELLGSQPAAEAWLEHPAMALDGRRPIDLLSTPAGVEVLETHLTRLEFGVYT